MMKEPKSQETGDTRVESMDRRDFCKKAIKRTSIAAAVGVAGYIAYKKPAVRSFFGAKEAYATTTLTGAK
jgi:predicted transcriptional regulator